MINSSVPVSASEEKYWLGPLLILVFLVEGIVAKGSVPGIGIGFSDHLLFTAIWLGILILAGEILPVGPHWAGIAKRSTSVFRSAMLLGLAGVASAVLQQRYWAGNCAFALLLAGTYYVAFRSIPRLLSSWSANECLRGFGWLFAILTIGCLCVQASIQDRFTGIFGNATYTGAFLSIIAIYWLYLLVIGARRPTLWIAFLAASIALLVMTRTRNAIGAAAFGGAVVLGYPILSRAALSPRPWWIAWTGMFVSVAAILAATLDLVPYSTGDVGDYLRLPSSIGDKYDTRTALWAAGWRDFLGHGLTGEGYLAKYAGSSDTSIMGVSVPRYDWTTFDDPLNSLFLVDKQIGPLGVALYLILLLNMVKVSIESPIPIRCLLLGILAAGTTFGLLSGNWLLSFGDAFDRWSFALLGTTMFTDGHDTPARDDSDKSRVTLAAPGRSPETMHSEAAWIVQSAAIRKCVSLEA